MEIPVNVAIQFHEVLVLLGATFILFIAGTWLSEKIKTSVNRKATVLGSTEVCGACDALILSKKIPDLENEQKILRAPTGVLAKLDKTVGELTVTTASLKNDVSKLFTMIESDWQNQIQNLKTKLAEKDQQIRRLEDKG